MTPASHASFAEPPSLTLAIQAHMSGRIAEAEQLYLAAIEHVPDNVQANQYLGVLLYQTGRVEQGLAYLESAYMLAPDDPEVLLNFGNVCRETLQLDRALKLLSHCVGLRPGWSVAHQNLGAALLMLGDARAAVEQFGAAVEADPNNREAASNLILSSLYRDDEAPHAEALAKTIAADSSPRPPRPDRPLRTIGFVSGDLGDHPVGVFLEPVLGHIDRDRYRVVLFSNQNARDFRTDRLEAIADETHVIAGLSDDAVARMVQSMEIDVLVDLAGHTAKNRLGLFNLRPAPIQATWLGFPGTTGLSTFDLLLADPVVLPDRGSGAYTEPVAHLPHAFLALDVRPYPQPSPDAPYRQNGHVTFGSFNAAVKISRRTVTTWSRVLNRFRGSRMLLKSPSFVSEAARRRVMALFLNEGVYASRLMFLGPTDRDEHWGAYADVDVCLDTMPYTGATTTVETLAMGVPVVTRQGGRFSERMSASILAAAGFPDWIATTDEEFVERACWVAEEVMDGAIDRLQLRRQAETSCLADTVALTRAMLAEFERCWEEAPLR